MKKRIISSLLLLIMCVGLIGCCLLKTNNGDSVTTPPIISNDDSVTMPPTIGNDDSVTTPPTIGNGDSATPPPTIGNGDSETPPPTIGNGDAANHPTFALASSTAKQGESFNVPIVIKNNPGITALQLRIIFDEERLSLTDVSHQELFASKSTCSGEYASPLNISWSSQQTIDEKENGIIAILTFTVKNTAAVGDTHITIAYDADDVVNSARDNISFETVNGSVSIIEDGYGVAFVYGKSELGRDLMCYSFTPENYTDTVLLNFAIHGFEDFYDRDGQVLVDTAYELINYYTENTQRLGTTRLLIVPCANPDGVYEGDTKDGFGRCNANGVDLNRDFDFDYKPNNVKGRNYTPYAFSASESRALRDLVNDYSADVVIDFHGWINCTMGDNELAQIFYEEMGLVRQYDFDDMRGHFAAWAHQQGALGLLVEFEDPETVPVDRVISATNRLLQGHYKLDFERFDTIKCCTLSTGYVATYQLVDTSFVIEGYIDGKNDQVTIMDVYNNGWVKVEYQPGSGGSTKMAFCLLSDFISEDDIVDEFYEISVSKLTKVYYRSDMTEEFGDVAPYDTIIVVGETENALQIIYSLDSGGYKMGWIQK